ncbi:oligosaccharide flippase family protein [Streptomyces coeruleorubidus]|uniref:oligosaccharide flippase family protein n=1 Tax=Streptomyces coeruleorubidus TaxID=116188 RepID=UPI00237F8CE9|nr:oligosaccharide flippase family protein [Streptomyces coeruleorubidus]WDV54243.1 oligosaccharide flippase family protein [Streptomyces coeruleorubidus]
MISLRWNIAGSVVVVLLQLGYTAYTARVVDARAYGAYAIALTVVPFFGYFANAGLSACVLRSERLTLPFVRAARHLGMISGAVCFLLVEAVAPVFGSFFHMPDVTVMARLLACMFLLQPSANVTVTAMRRAGAAPVAVLAESLGQAVGVATATGLLVCGWSPFGLALAQPVAAAVSLSVGTAWIARRPLPPGPPVRARDLLAPSGFMTSHSLGQFVTNNIPLWVSGRLLGPGAAGPYSRASLFTGLLLTFLYQGINWAVTPLLAERRAEGLRFGQDVERTLCAASAVAFIGFGITAGIGPAALGMLLGPGWEQAVALVPVLSAGAAMTLLGYCGGLIDQVRDAPRALLGTLTATVVATVAGVAAAAFARDLLLVAGAAAVGQVVGHLVQLAAWHRSGLMRAGAALRMHGVHLAVGAALGGAAALGSADRPAAAALGHGLVAMVPVVLVCVILRGRIPVFRVAVATGLLRSRRRRTSPLRSSAAADPSDRPR